MHASASLPAATLVLLALAAGCSSAAPAAEDPAAAQPGEGEQDSAPLEPLETTRVLAATTFLPPAVRPRSPATLDQTEARDALHLLEAGEARQAAILLEALRRNSRNPDLLRLHGYSLVAAGEWESAERLARNAADTLAEDDPGPAWIMANALFMQGRLVEANPWFQRVVAATPSDTRLLERAAQAALQAEDAAFALQCVDQIMVTKPLSREMARVRAQALEATGQYVAALRLYERMLAETPEDAGLWDAAGLAAFRGAHEEAQGMSFAGASRFFQSAVELDPQNSRYYYNLACALDWGEEVSGSESAYLRALELDPVYLSAAENLASMLLRQGRPEEARHVLEQLLRQPLSAEELGRVHARLETVDRDEEAGRPAVPSGRDGG